MYYFKAAFIAEQSRTSISDIYIVVGEVLSFNPGEGIFFLLSFGMANLAYTRIDGYIASDK